MLSDAELVERANRRVGAVLCGKYTVDRVLGVGGMAVVYAATHRNRKQVAIKMLHPELSLNTEICKRFLREGYVANSVKHRGAVDVIDDDVAEDGAAFLVMELLEGAPVDVVVERAGGVLRAPEALAIAHELCGVLAAAHANGIIHRDIKPANLFVTHEGELKVLDFGIARLRDASSAHATGTGMTLGTPAYMSPEQATGKMSEIGPATDIWAVGATLFTLLTARNVHDADTAQMMMIQTATAQARSLAEVMPAAPPKVVTVVDRALRLDPRERWESGASMRAALRDALGAASTASILAPLVGGSPNAPSIPAPSDPAETRPSGKGATAVMGPPPGADARPAAIGATTATPVSQSFIQPIASKKSAGLVVGALLVVAAAVGVLAVARTKTDDAGGAAANAAGLVEPPLPASSSPASPALPSGATGAATSDAPPPSASAAPASTNPTAQAGAIATAQAGRASGAAAHGRGTGASPSVPAATAVPATATAAATTGNPTPTPAATKTPPPPATIDLGAVR